MSQQGWLDTPDKEAEFYYSVAGSFVAYIYHNFGVTLLKKIYSILDRKNAKEKNVELLESMTGKTIKDIEHSWSESIQ